MRITRFLSVSYLAFGTLMFSLQTRLIFPGQESQGQEYSEVRPRNGAELVRLKTASGVPIVALYGPSLDPDGRPDPRAGDRPTLIDFYGNGMCLNDTIGKFEQYRRLGLNVIFPEYVGYGMSGGKPSEIGCRETAEAAYEYLLRTRKVPADRIIAAGWSLGGAVAIDLASRHRVAGLIVFSTFTSMSEMARRMAPMLPVSLLLRHRFDSLRKLPTITCPILIGHGRRDRVVPFVMGERLAKAAKAPVTTLWIDGADHNDFFRVAVVQVDRAILQFVDRPLRDRRPPER